MDGWISMQAAISSERECPVLEASTVGRSCIGGQVNPQRNLSAYWACWQVG
jgi:hypothetical protein